MEDVVERLRVFKSAAAQSWAHEAADEIESLRAQLAEERQQLLATQAHAALSIEVLKFIDGLDPHKDSTTAWNIAFNKVKSALSTPINLDALLEGLARECERLADRFHAEGYDDVPRRLREEATAHRAKKEGK